MTPQETVDEWNRRYPPGTEAECRRNPEEIRIVRTASVAFLMRGVPAVRIEGDGEGEGEAWCLGNVAPTSLVEARRLRAERDALCAACRAMIEAAESHDSPGKARALNRIEAALALVERGRDG